MKGMSDTITLGEIIVALIVVIIIFILASLIVFVNNSTECNCPECEPKIIVKEANCTYQEANLSNTWCWDILNETLCLNITYLGRDRLYMECQE